MLTSILLKYFATYGQEFKSFQSGDKYDMMASIEKFWVQNPINVLFDLKHLNKDDR